MSFLKETVLKQAAQALGQWFVEQQMTADALAAKLTAGEPVLESAINALPTHQIGGIRLMVRPVIQSMTETDYARVLDYLWELGKDYPPCADIAVLLKRPDMFWGHFHPAMEKVKTWLATGSPV